MYKQVLIVCFLVCIMFLGTGTSLNHDFSPRYEAEIDPCALSNDAYRGGEEILYNIYYKAAFIWLRAGEVKFNIEDMGSYYKIVAKGYTLPFYDKFYTVRDHYETHLDKETLLPRLFIRDVNEGDYSIYDKIVFDHQTKTATTYRKHKGKEETLKGNYETCVQDMLSILYYVRNIDLKRFEPGADIPISVYHENRTYDLEIHYTDYDKDKKFKGYKKMPAYEFKPDLIKNYIISDDHNMSIWVTDDANKVPMEIETNLTVGKMKAVLQSWKNLKHPFSVD